jgi:hypothetical protein
MRRAPLAAMLTLLAAFAATVAIAGCGGKSTGTPANSSTTSTTHKQPSHAPAY